MNNKPTSNDLTAASRRRALAADLEAFLASGRQIEQIPSGVSGQDPQGRSQKQIDLGNNRQRRT